MKNNNNINPWTQLSIDYASQRSYLDDLFQVYPTIPEGIREINGDSWKEVEQAFEKRDNISLLQHLLKFDLFPIKDSYVAYLKRDKNALERNPATAARLSGRLYEMGLDAIYARCSEPKETNRQIGPLFKRWLRKKALGVEPLKLDEFIKRNVRSLIRKIPAKYNNHETPTTNQRRTSRRGLYQGMERKRKADHRQTRLHSETITSIQHLSRDEGVGKADEAIV